MARQGVWWVAATVAAVLGAAAQAQVPPQPPPKPHHTPGQRTLPPPPNDAVSGGLSLEHACLNAVGAMRHSPKMMQPDPGFDTTRAASLEHLEQAEEAARAGHGQICENELGLAAENLN